MAQRILSFKDIEYVPEASEVHNSGDTELIQQMLYNVGFDVSRPIDKVLDTHRPMSSTQEVTTYRYVGTERQDQEWLLSGNCSDLNRMELVGKRDVSLQADLLNMSRSPQYSAALAESMNSGVQDVEMKFVEEKEEDEQ